jgi:hypothetical protein
MHTRLKARNAADALILEQVFHNTPIFFTMDKVPRPLSDSNDEFISVGMRRQVSKQPAGPRRTTHRSAKVGTGHGGGACRPS